jgi:hypothetical protein
MLYQFFQTMTDLATPMRLMAEAGLRTRPMFGSLAHAPLANSAYAALDMIANIASPARCAAMPKCLSARN